MEASGKGPKTRFRCKKVRFFELSACSARSNTSNHLSEYAHICRRRLCGRAGAIERAGGGEKGEKMHFFLQQKRAFFPFFTLLFEFKT